PDDHRVEQPGQKAAVEAGEHEVELDVLGREHRVGAVEGDRFFRGGHLEVLSVAAALRLLAAGASRPPTPRASVIVAPWRSPSSSTPAAPAGAPSSGSWTRPRPPASRRSRSTKRATSRASTAAPR